MAALGGKQWPAAAGVRAAAVTLASGQRGLTLVLSGPSGCGKTTLAQQLEERGSLVRSVSVTTRPPRPGEVEGSDYFFVSESRFEDLLGAGELLEHTAVFDQRYGTPRGFVEGCVAQGMDVLLVLDAAGRRQLVDRYGSAVVSVFLLPPTLAELGRRLHGRVASNAAEVDRRLAAAVHEMEGSVDYDHMLVNRDREETLTTLVEIVQVARGELR
jgi:guanylate kinase